MKKGWRPLAYLLAAILTAGTLQMPVQAAESETIIIQSEEDDSDQTPDQSEDIFFETEEDGNAEEEEEPAAGTYTVTLDANGGIFFDQWDDSLGRTVERAEVLTKIVPVGESVEAFPAAVEPVNEGQSVSVFAGWSFSREGEAVFPEGEAFIPDADCCLYAVWQTGEAADPAEAAEEPEAVIVNTDAKAPGADAEAPGADEEAPGADEEAPGTEAVSQDPGETGESSDESESVEDPAERAEDTAESEEMRIPAEAAESQKTDDPVEEAESEAADAAAEEVVDLTEAEELEESAEVPVAEVTEAGEAEQAADEDPEEAGENGVTAEAAVDEAVPVEEEGAEEVVSSPARMGSAAEEPDIPEVTSISLDREEIATNINGSDTLDYSYAPDEADPPTVEWSSSNEDVVTVENGSLTYWSDGESVITASVKDHPEIKASCKVTVVALVDEIILSETSITVNKGKTAAVKIKEFLPNDPTNKNVTWKSSNTKIATVDAKGNVKGIAKGTATITATAKDGGGAKASCKVTVKVPVTKITLAKTKLTLNKGKKAALKVKSVAPSNAGNKAVTWKSSNKKIATVDAKGNVKAIAKGTATITATAKDGSGKKASCKVTVIIPVTKISLNKKSVSVKGGGKVALKATVYPSNASNKTVKWSSGNSVIASVSAKGVVKGLTIGTTTITGTAKDGSKKKVTSKVKVKSNAAVIASGKWPASGSPAVKWKIVPNKPDVPIKKCGCTLIITGKGEMETSCEDGDDAYPWGRYRSLVTDLRVGKGITQIASGAFRGFTRLKKVDLPNGLKDISDAAFGRCTALKEILVPDSVTFMGFPFVDCTALTSFRIPAGVKNIDEYCFSGCKNLKSITIHANVKKIYSYAFEDCSSLKDVYYTGTEKQWKSIQIDEGNTLLKKAKIHYNSK